MIFLQTSRRSVLFAFLALGLPSAAGAQRVTVAKDTRVSTHYSKRMHEEFFSCADPMNPARIIAVSHVFPRVGIGYMSTVLYRSEDGGSTWALAFEDMHGP